MEQMEKLRFPPELEQWIAYAVLTGHPDESILPQLSNQGFSDEALRGYLKELRSSPLLSVGQDFARQLSQTRWLLDLQKTVHSNAHVEQTVPRIDASEVDRFFNDFLAANRPVILENLIPDWPALERWEQEGLTQRLGDHPIQYTRYFVQNNRHEPEKLDATFGEFLSLVYDENYKDPIYWTAYNQGDEASTLLKGLQEDIIFPPAYCTPKEGMRTFFWIGPEGTRSGLHFDPYNVFFVQVKGRKRFLLYPPQDIPNAYLEHDFFSQVDAEAPDLARFPKFAQAQGLSVEVGPGETLLLPVGWLHQVRSLSTSYSVSLTCLNLPAGGSNFYQLPSEYRGIL